MRFLMYMTRRAVVCRTVMTENALTLHAAAQRPFLLFDGSYLLPVHNIQAIKCSGVSVSAVIVENDNERRVYTEMCPSPEDAREAFNWYAEQLGAQRRTYPLASDTEREWRIGDRVRLTGEEWDGILAPQAGKVYTLVDDGKGNASIFDDDHGGPWYPHPGEEWKAERVEPETYDTPDRPLQVGDRVRLVGEQWRPDPSGFCDWPEHGTVHKLQADGKGRPCIVDDIGSWWYPEPGFEMERINENTMREPVKEIAERLHREVLLPIDDALAAAAAEGCSAYAAVHRVAKHLGLDTSGPIDAVLQRITEHQLHEIMRSIFGWEVPSVSLGADSSIDQKRERLSAQESVSVVVAALAQTANVTLKGDDA